MKKAKTAKITAKAKRLSYAAPAPLKIKGGGGYMATRTESIAVSKTSHDVSELVRRVADGKERIYFTSHNKKIVALVPIEDLEVLEAMETEEDIREAELALKEIEEKGSISFEEMKRRVGL